MCYTQTLYHSPCSHYSRPQLLHGGCVRATSSSGMSRGCWDTVDLGLETSHTLCARCAKRNSLTPSLAGSTLSSRRESGHSDSSPRRADSDASAQSVASIGTATSGPQSRREERATLSRISSEMLLKITGARQAEMARKAALLAGTVASGDDGVERSLHWRAMNGAGYDEDGPL